jgi:hypothetical protein
MSNRTENLLPSAFLPAALLCSLIGGAPAFANSTTSAEFTVATCRDAMDDLAKVDAMAQERNWTTAPGDFSSAQNNVFKLRSAWTITQGEDRFVVATGLSQIGGNIGTGNLCMVMFPGVKVHRDEFFDTMSAAMELKPMANMTLPQGRMEMFEIKSAGPAKLLWREFGTWNNARQPRDHVDGNVQAFQALNADIACVLGADGKLWREFGARDNAQQPRRNVDGHVRAFQALDASIVYVLGYDGKLWREFGTWNNAMQPRIQVDGSVRSFQALDVDMVYVLGNNGNLWREFGTWNSAQRPRVQVDGNV